MKFFKEKPQKAVLTVATLLVFLLTITALMLTMAPSTKTEDPDEVLAMVNGEKIVRSDLLELFKTDLMLTDEDIKSGNFDQTVLLSLIEKEIVRQKARELGIVATTIEVEKEMAESEFLAGNYVNLNSSEKVVVDDSMKHNILKRKVSEAVLSFVEADYFKIRFDRHFIDVNDGTEEQKAADKKYATELRDKIYTQLVEGKITFEEAQIQVQADKFIDLATYKGTYGLQYGAITKENWYTLIKNEDYPEKILGIKKGEISKDITGMVLSEGDQGDSIGAYYLVVKINSTKKGEANFYEEWLEKEIQKRVKNNSKFSLVQEAKAEAYYYTNVYAKYVTWGDNVYNINGITIDIKSNDTTNTALCANGLGAYRAVWKRNTSGTVTRTRYRVKSTSPCATETANDTSAGKGFLGCQANNYKLFYSWHSDTEDRIKNGKLYAHPDASSATGVNLSNVASPSNGDITPATTNIRVANDAAGYLRLYVRRNAYPEAKFRSPANAAVFSTTNDVSLKGYFTDHDGDKSTFSFRYRSRQNSSSSWGAWTRTTFNSTTKQSPNIDFTKALGRMAAGEYQWQVAARNEDTSPKYYTGNKKEFWINQSAGTYHGEIYTDGGTRTFKVVPPASCSLTASPASISSTTPSTTLSWTTSNATAVKAITPTNWTTKTTINDTQSVTPSARTTYTLEATGSGGTGTCSETISYNPTLSVAINPAGTGKVTGTGINCGAGAGTDCTEVHSPNATNALTATPAAGYKFTGWSGCFTGTTNPYTVSMGTTNKYCVANFAEPANQSPIFKNPEPVNNSVLTNPINANRSVNIRITLEDPDNNEKVAYEIKYRKDGELGWRSAPVCAMNSVWQNSPLRRTDCNTPLLGDGKWWWYAVGYGDKKPTTAINSAQYSFTLNRAQPTANLLINGSKTPPITESATATYSCSYTNATKITIRNKTTNTVLTSTSGRTISSSGTWPLITEPQTINIATGTNEYECVAENYSKSATSTVSLTRIGLNCAVVPQSGTAPLTVRVTPSPIEFTPSGYEYDFGDGSDILDTVDSVAYYAYKIPDVYTIKIRALKPDNISYTLWRDCTPQITVKDPTDGSGGETN